MRKVDNRQYKSRYGFGLRRDELTHIRPKPAFKKAGIKNTRQGGACRSTKRGRRSDSKLDRRARK
jgi:hypothetical protein